MNILYLCADRGIPIRGHKGASIHVRALADAWQRAGHRVTLLTPRPGPEDGPATLANVMEVPLAPGSGEVQLREYADTLFEFASGLMAQQSFDFIYERYSLWSDVGARLAQAAGKPLVLEVNAPLRQEAAVHRTLTDDAAAQRIEAVQFSGAAFISAVSEEVRAYVIQHGGAEAKVRVLPNGIDPQHFHPAVRFRTLRRPLGLKGKIVVGFVGRPRPWHDLETLLAAVAQLHAEDPRYHLLLVGEVAEALRPALAARDFITLAGPVPHNEVPRYIAAMDVAVSPHPPLANFYFSPLKLFEYMACGVPAVAAAIGQPAQLIRHGENGYLYPPGDAPALADCIRAVIAEPEAARDVAWRGATEVHARHTWERNARAIIEWIDPPPPPPEVPLQWTREVPVPIFDAKLRHRLYRATRVDLAARTLAHYLPEVRTRDLETIRVLKYKPGRRCVLAYHFARRRSPPAPQPHIVIGKVYRDERGLRLAELQSRLWRNGFGPQAPDEIHVPQPLAYIPEMHLFVQAHAAGHTLQDLVPHVKAGALVRRAAEALAKLHRSAAPCEGLIGAYTLDDELAALHRFREEMTAHRPAFALEAESFRAALEAWGRQLPALDAPTLIHRDFYYSQLLFDGPRVTLIDFDLLALGDPAIDVANFSAHLFLLGLDRLSDGDALAAEAEAFVQAYAERRRMDNAFRQRLAFYEAATYFRLLSVVGTRPGLERCFEPLHRRLAQCLATPSAVTTSGCPSLPLGGDRR